MYLLNIKYFQKLRGFTVAGITKEKHIYVCWTKIQLLEHFTEKVDSAIRTTDSLAEGGWFNQFKTKT